MHIIIGIIVVLIIIGFLKELVIEYWPIILVGVGVIVSFVWGGPLLGIGIIVAIFIWFKLSECIEAYNEKDLKSYLSNKCLKLGQVSIEEYGKIAPEYVNKKYPQNSSYIGIVSGFINESEKKYITNAGVDKWIMPALAYLHEHGMADTYELCQVVKDSPSLKYTHTSSVDKLVTNAMEKRCKEVKDADGKPVFVKVILNEEEVKKELEKKHVTYSQFYLNAYKLNKINAECLDTFESEEISFEELDFD